MKTTVELSDALLADFKAEAKKEGASMRELMETALRAWLEQKRASTTEYRFQNHPFDGRGVQEGIDEGSWDQVRGVIYEGRGG